MSDGGNENSISSSKKTAHWYYLALVSCQRQYYGVYSDTAVELHLYPREEALDADRVLVRPNQVELGKLRPERALEARQHCQLAHGVWVTNHGLVGAHSSPLLSVRKQG